jgi:hypothetical protein
MLLTTRESARWRRWVFLLFLGLTAAYLVYRWGRFPHGGSWPGIAFGLLATLLIGLLLGYGVRKRQYRSRRGTMEAWLQSHVYLGLLSLVVVLYHSGFRFEDKVAVTALVVLSLVVLTGLFGAILYTTVPRLLTDVQGDATPEELSVEVQRFNRSMARLAKGRSPTFRRIHERLAEEMRPRPLSGWRILFRPVRLAIRRGAGDGGAEDSGWTELLRRVEKDEQEDLRELLVRSRQAREQLHRLVAQQRYKNLLEVWLYAHVPLSLALAVLVLAHLVAVFYYRGLTP